MQLTANGGAGDDVLIGSAGNDILHGDAGDDILIGGPGLDILDRGTGNNIVIQSNAPPSGGSQSCRFAGPVHGIELRHGRRGQGATPIADAAAANQQPLLAQPHA